LHVATAPMAVQQSGYGVVRLDETTGARERSSIPCAFFRIGDHRPCYARSTTSNSINRVLHYHGFSPELFFVSASRCGAARHAATLNPDFARPLAAQRFQRAAMRELAGADRRFQDRVDFIPVPAEGGERSIALRSARAVRFRLCGAGRYRPFAPSPPMPAKAGDILNARDGTETHGVGAAGLCAAQNDAQYLWQIEMREVTQRLRL